ncbi:MAG: hypothetical protein ACRDA3_02140 [Peptostreptococcaceae bacterium]
MKSNGKKINIFIGVSLLIVVTIIKVIGFQYSGVDKKVILETEDIKKANEEKTQSQNTSKSDSIKDAEKDNFPVNANGETYGTSIYTEDGEYIDPDLIETIGEDNVEGYVKYEDVFGHTNEYDYKNLKKSIPLYEVDGTTVIGEFIIEDRDTIGR